ARAGARSLVRCLCWRPSRARLDVDAWRADTSRRDARIGDSWRQERPSRRRAARYTARVTGGHESIALPRAGRRAAGGTITALSRGIKEAYAVSRLELGRTEWGGGGRRGERRPGEPQLKQPDDVHRDIRRDGICRVQLVVFDTRLVEAACR